MKRVYVVYLVMTVLLLAFLNGCTFRELKKEVREMSITYVLSGTVVNESPYKGEEIVVVFKEEEGELVLYDYSLVEEIGHFSLFVPAGIYYVAAFEDRNLNFCYDKGEFGNFFKNQEKIIVPVSDRRISKTESRNDLDIIINSRDGIEHKYPIFIDAETISRKSFFKLGQVKDLDDPIFTQNNGSMGYWKPMSFLRNVGMGIFFLEQYDPDKIPVLFVHGATGTPIGWQTIVENMDSSRYQPWFFYYPSGVRLNLIALALNTSVERLHELYDFNKLYLLAHSMGGLVTRSFIMKNMENKTNDYIKLFVSVSSPWNGHPATEAGVKNAPEAVPSWHDMVPDSEFIQSLFSSRLPHDVLYYLFFTFKGDRSLFMANNDGTVEISSQLDERAQRDADRLFGYNEDHDSILASKEFIRQFNFLLYMLDEEDRAAVRGDY